ncbi:hypothetical protein Q31b_36330 [Novipirellula aureliae]|uniref:DUF4303 domain-containing protein n=1 Tax=Novipirellula aureliae TaxID=2527966 RepID=A0A5C6DYY7_9BACT|nr:DUF4303 domain-containing protein [Novipirellula aureliae]TWU40286.1 hypothetical protein Q31b_36330 [Novipirellula aureliae]
MKSLVYSELEELCSVFRDALASHLSDLNANSQSCGHAILIGEDIHQLNAIAVTNTEDDITALDDPSFADQYRYMPDEWQHWHQKAFSGFNDALDAVYGLFRERHPEREDDYSYSKEEQAYIIDVCCMYLGAAMDCAKEGEYGNISYRCIWISDCNYPIIAESIRRLNDPSVAKNALKLFGE